MTFLGTLTLVHAPQSSWPKSVVYPIVGVLLALGAPLGLIAFRRVLARDFSFRGAWLELTQDVTTYAYLTVSTALVFMTLGFLVGRSTDKLRASATTDPLTHLANRRHFDDRVLLELRRAKRYGVPLSLLMVDVDHLKRINDERGHEAGDVALRRVADALGASCRETDFAARWGGDEFAVLTPGTTADEAVRLAERIREALRRACGGGEPTQTTVSIGIADASRPEGATPEGLHSAADAALYEAKSTGRDRAVVYLGNAAGAIT